MKNGGNGLIIRKRPINFNDWVIHVYAFQQNQNFLHMKQKLNFFLTWKIGINVRGKADYYYFLYRSGPYDLFYIICQQKIK